MQEKTKMQKKGNIFFQIPKNVYAKKGLKYYLKKTGKKRQKCKKKRLQKKAHVVYREHFIYFSF